MIRVFTAGIVVVKNQDEHSPHMFLLGVGAQKSGTTWLYAQLAKHPEVSFGWKKELSFWGSLWDKKLADRKPKRLRNRLRDKFYHFPNGKRIPHYPLFTSWLAREYFDELKRIVAEGTRVVSDVTPHYAAISAKGFDTIKKLSVKNGFTLRVLFIMRDPVERVISGVMHSNRRLKNPTNEELVDLVSQTYQSYPVEARTRYDKTIQNLESVFSPSDTHYVFFEELFTTETMNGIEKWLNISPIPADFDERIGPGTHKVSIPQELRKDIRNHYQPVYEFCEKKFGAAKVNSLWKNA